MASKKANVELTNAERVRNNQRRSRARRKEYITGLEAKIQQYESGYDQNPIKPSIEELAKELDTLKKLLNALGLDDKFLEAHGRAARLASTWAQDKQSPEETNDTPLSLPQPTSQFTNGLQAHPDPILQSINVGAQHSTPRRSLERLNPLDSTLLCDLFALPMDPTSISDSLETPNLFGQPHDHSAMDLSTSTTPLGLESSTTTLCTIAFSRILESNRRGFSATDLDLKLRVGYRFSATPLEGCRVDNHILLDVLAEIL
ncbi:unnamed protein product [Alternaria alternata]